MRLVKSSFCALFFSFGVCASESEVARYDIYELKVASCIAEEKLKDPILALDLKGLDRESIAKGIFYLKDRRLVECSALEEIDSLSQELSSGGEEVDLPVLKSRYISLGLVDKRKEFYDLSIKERSILKEAVKGKSLEVNLIDLFESIDGQN